MGRELTKREEAFVQHYAEHGDRKAAEKYAGYAAGSGLSALNKPEVIQRITSQQLARVKADALPLAISTLISIMENPKSPANARVQASKIVLERGLPVEEGTGNKALHEMSAAEISEMINKLEGQAVARAKDVTPAPEKTIEQQLDTEDVKHDIFR